MIRGWMAEAGKGLEIVFIQKMMDQSITSVDEKDPWFKAFNDACLKARKLMSTHCVFICLQMPLSRMASVCDPESCQQAQMHDALER